MGLPEGDPPVVTFREAAGFWGKLALVSFGGLCGVALRGPGRRGDLRLAADRPDDRRTGPGGDRFLGGWNLTSSLGFALLAGLVEASRGNRRLSAPLTAITTAVAGVIASLAVFFAGPVL